MARKDKTDLKILQLLQENSKRTNLALSKLINLSPAPTLERVKKLERRGFIESYHAVVNKEKMGLNVVTFVLVNLGWHKPNALDRFIRKIEKIDEVVQCYVVTGDADLLIKVIAADIPAYERLLFKTLSKIEEIERLKTLMVLSEVKNSTVLPLKYD